MPPDQKNLRQTSTPSAVDLCCGLGGLSLSARNLGIAVMAGVDIDPCALKTFGRNFPEAKTIEGSVRSAKVLEQCSDLLRRRGLPAGPTIVLSGPPCQGFSAAGSRDPADPRNQVIVAVARAIATLQPECALVENVSMVFAAKHGVRIGLFEETLVEAGYHATSVLLDASEYGLAQRRRRAFFLISRTELQEDQILRKLAPHKTPPIGAEQALRGLPAPKVRGDTHSDETDYGLPPNHLAMRHSPRVIRKIARILPGSGPMSYRRLHPLRPSNTLFSGHRAPPAHFKDPRSITVREAARLQGFPDDFRIYGSFSNQMEQVTNAVPPPLAQVVLQVLLDLTEVACQDERRRTKVS